jgi:hypothetical protein
LTSSDTEDTEPEKQAVHSKSGVTHRLLYSETVGALCKSDYKGVGNQYVADGKLIIER